MNMNTTWKSRLDGRMPEDLAREIDVFEQQIVLRKQGKMDEKLFAETRLRRGAYGQRYDNGQRHDGVRSRRIPYTSGELTKGPETIWDAPGMLRIKIPFGGLTAAQMETLADLAEEYSDSILHVTTRQDFQFHFVHIDDTPDLFRRLAASGITTREACGNTVRNVTACPIAGVCRDETFDVTPYAKACADFLLGHKDTQDFGRKFKIAFSGCAGHACGLAMMHDIGAIARTRVVDGIDAALPQRVERGFEFYIGGGLGAVPYQAKLFDEFLPVEELLPISQAISRVFARLGEKKNRAAARLKFLVKKLGIEEFKRLVMEERASLPTDPRWTDWLSSVENEVEKPGLSLSDAPATTRQAAVELNQDDHDDKLGFEQWSATNVKAQRQEGYSSVMVTLPLGDISSRQMRALADVTRRYIKDTIRTTVEQNILLRWVRNVDLPALYRDLAKIRLNESGAESIVDVTACPGTDTCKLGIASSRGLAAELRERLMARELQFNESVRDMRIKVSGCFNSCGQHHIADIGFYGSNRTIGGYAVPHFQLLLGGEWSENAGHYGLAIGAIPSKRIPEVVDRLIERYLKERRNGESFRVFMGRLGKLESKAMFDDLVQVPAHDKDPSIYIDWHDSREFSIGDMGKGECAGEVVSMFDFDLAEAEREVFAAQIHLDEIDEETTSEENRSNASAAIKTAYKAMVSAAHALNRIRNIDASSDPASVVEAFRRDFFDTQIFFDRFGGGRFAQFLFNAHASVAHERVDIEPTPENAHQRVEEAQLFIEAAHACQLKIVSAQATATPQSAVPSHIPTAR